MIGSQRLLIIVFLLIGLCGLNACGQHRHHAPAPVSILYMPSLKANQYSVREGDTLFSIAWAYGLSEDHLIKSNGLVSPYLLHIGQVLKLNSKPHHLSHAPKQRLPHRRSFVEHTTVIKPFSKHKMCWQLPVQSGQVQLAEYPYHGLFVMGGIHAKVRAMASGRVVYSGSGLKGYGNMILIQMKAGHKVVAYAFNRKNLVTVGKQVKKGQVIAMIGSTPKKRYGVYIEVRDNGHPMDNHLVSDFISKRC